MNISHRYSTNIDNTNGYIKKKKFVTEEELSQNLNKNNKTPLERTNKQISFKGVSTIMLKKLDPIPLKSSMEIIKEGLGESAQRLYNHIQKNPKLSERAQVNLAEDTIQMFEKNPLYLAVDFIKYPFTKLPFEISKSVTDFLGKKGIIKKIDTKNSKTFYARTVDALENDDILNSLQGYLQKAQEYKNDPAKIRNANFFNDAMKMFDPKSGNYNGVHERALTRVVTGFIPAFFLANDAYNLSRFCDDDPKEATEEKKLRFNQESKRVLSNAYIQLITLGALSKFINRSKAWFIGNTVVTVLFTEIYSRISNGKRIHFISKEEAQKINAKEKAKKEALENKNKPVETNETTVQPIQQTEPTTQQKHSFSVEATPGFKGSIAFKDFGIASKISDMAPVSVAEKRDKNVKELKPLLNLETLLMWVGGTVAVGFAMKKAKGIKIDAKNKKTIGKYTNDFSSVFKNFYNKITTQKNEISRDEFNAIVNKLIGYDAKFGNYYKSVIENYQKHRIITANSSQITKELEQAGLIHLSHSFSTIGSTVENAFLSKSDHALERNSKFIAKNFETFYDFMSKNGHKGIAQDIKKILFDNKGIANTSKYSEAIKFLNDKTLKRQFDNVFKIDYMEENIKLFDEAMDALKLKNPEVAEKYIRKANNAVNADKLELLDKNRFLVKELVDFIKEPFKFIWGVIKLPYTIVDRAVKSFSKEAVAAPSWTPEIKAVSNSVKKLSKNVNKNDVDFAKYIDKSLNKGFNAITMSNVSNSDLSALAKNTSTAATLSFLVTDNYNMVMLKSNGEDKQEANLKAKERVVQETSRLFYQQLFINLFNNTFRNVYNSSLLGAQAVNAASTLTGEYFTRTAIGMPIKEHSRDEILKQEYDNITSEGARGKFFRFMSRLTGKRVLSQREQPVKAPKKEESVK